MEEGIEMSFPSKNVKIIRERLDLDCTEFSKLIGVSERSVRRWESKNVKIGGPSGEILNSINFGMDHCPDILRVFIKYEVINFGGLSLFIVRLIESYLAYRDIEGKKS